MERLYSKLPNLIFGFHGCDRSVAETVLYKNQELKTSINTYDWLGNGIYFWENSYSRALDWAKHSAKVEEPFVLGAIIDLGHCLNLTDFGSFEILKQGYRVLRYKSEINGVNLPKNRGKSKDNDYLLRDLDCAVIEQIHEMRREENEIPYDSVRGLFQEGKPIYEGSGFLEKTHIQLCVRNPNCIKGYFVPKQANIRYSMP
ncbi:hypothetical protein LI177_05855 [bacterium 210820-DFI.6.37]|nr:hypothetical protein [bacterium 210820-DFI.6.37]